MANNMERPRIGSDGFNHRWATWHGYTATIEVMDDGPDHWMAQMAYDGLQYATKSEVPLPDYRTKEGLEKLASIVRVLMNANDSVMKG